MACSSAAAASSYLCWRAEVGGGGGGGHGGGGASLGPGGGGRGWGGRGGGGGGGGVRERASTMMARASAVRPACSYIWAMLRTQDENCGASTGALARRARASSRRVTPSGL